MRVAALRLILPVALVILPAAVILPRALAPEPTHLTPTYDVWVVSESDHHPLAGIAVTERFGDDNPQTLTSDAQGHVHFESRVAPGISLIRRLFTRPSVRLPLGATNFATISAAPVVRYVSRKDELGRAARRNGHAHLHVSPRQTGGSHRPTPNRQLVILNLQSRGLIRNARLRALKFFTKSLCSSY